METFFIILIIAVLLGGLIGLLASSEEDRLFGIGFGVMAGFSITLLCGVVYVAVHFINLYW